MPFKIPVSVRKEIFKKLLTSPERKALYERVVPTIEKMFEHPAAEEAHIFGSFTSKKPIPGDVDLLLKRPFMSMGAFEGLESGFKRMGGKLDVTDVYSSEELKALLEQIKKSGQKRYGKDYSTIRILGLTGALGGSMAALNQLSPDEAEEQEQSLAAQIVQGVGSFLSPSEAEAFPRVKFKTKTLEEAVALARSRILDRIKYGVREEIATEPSRKAKWSNTGGWWVERPDRLSTSAKWFKALSPEKQEGLKTLYKDKRIELGDVVKLDANEILVPSKYASKLRKWFEQEAPPLPLYSGSSEATKLGREASGSLLRELVPDAVEHKMSQVSPEIELFKQARGIEKKKKLPLSSVMIPLGIGGGLAMSSLLEPQEAEASPIGKLVSKVVKGPASSAARRLIGHEISGMTIKNVVKGREPWRYITFEKTDDVLPVTKDVLNDLARQFGEDMYTGIAEASRPIDALKMAIKSAEMRLNLKGIGSYTREELTAMEAKHVNVLEALELQRKKQVKFLYRGEKINLPEVYADILEKFNLGKRVKGK